MILVIQYGQILDSQLVTAPMFTLAWFSLKQIMFRTNLMLIDYRPIVMSGQKLGHQVNSEETLVYTLEATFATRFWWNFIRTFVLAISRPCLNMGHVSFETRSPGQILGNSCLHSRGHICHPILMKLHQNVCLVNI